MWEVLRVSDFLLSVICLVCSRIKSAGSTLRRYGEQALQKEVHELLREWYEDITEAQCIFMRASHREKRVSQHQCGSVFEVGVMPGVMLIDRSLTILFSNHPPFIYVEDLLIGWTGSPLKEAVNSGAVRNIPIPTRRATLKEATRVYEELCSVRICSVSVREGFVKDQVGERADKAKTSSEAFKAAGSQAKKRDAKGTDHLKKREDKEKASKVPLETKEEEETRAEIDDELKEVLEACIDGNKERLSTILTRKKELREALFERHYFADDARFEKQDAALGLVGVAAVCGNTELLTWLLDVGVSPAIGGSPYVANKSKGVRTALRMYWGKNPTKYDYAGAGIPSPLTDKEVEEIGEKERAKRRKEREKKKEKAKERAEAAKPPEQRARELRAAAAEARMLGNRCAGCRRSLEGMTPFARLAYKYCSTDCVNKHRQTLNNL